MINDHVYEIQGDGDYVFRTFFNLANWKGANLDFASDASGQVLITLDRGRFRHQGGGPTRITLRENVPDSCDYWFDIYCGEDWFNTACNQYYEWYHRVRPWRLHIIDESNYVLRFCDTNDFNSKTPDLHINIGPIHPDDELTEDEMEILEEIKSKSIKD